MNEIQIFNNPEFGEIRTLETTDGKALFCGKDVAEALGYKDTRHAVSASCRYGVKCTVPHPQSPDKTIEMIFIPESDVYRLTFGSKLPTAEKFTDWVTEVVLPSIRKTGSYTAKPDDKLKAKRLEIMERNATARQAKVMLEFAKMGLSQASIECLANGATMLMTGKKLLPEPVVEETFTAAEVGVQLGISGNMVGRIANANGVKCEKYGMRVLDTAKNGKQIPTFRYNKDGVERIRELVRGNGNTEKV
jgi:prophage antirepressor-like protein